MISMKVTEKDRVNRFRRKPLPLKRRQDGCAAIEEQCTLQVLDQVSRLMPPSRGKSVTGAEAMDAKGMHDRQYSIDD